MEGEKEKTADATAAIEEQPREDSAGESDRRWPNVPFSEDWKYALFKSSGIIILSQMVVQPVFSWLAYLQNPNTSKDVALAAIVSDLADKVAYWISFGIIACCVGYSLRHASASWICLAAAVGNVGYSLKLVYDYCYDPENIQADTFSGALLLYSMSSVTRRWAAQSDDTRDTNASFSDEEKYGKSQTRPNHPSTRSTRLRSALGRMLYSKAALTLLVLIDIATLVYLPPDMLTDYLSTLNCEVEIEDLHHNRIFYEFTAHPTTKPSVFSLSYCPESQQWASLIREMTKHADEASVAAKAYLATKAARIAEWAKDSEWDGEDWDNGDIDYDQPVSCVAWCFLTGENDELQGIMSHPVGPKDLPEMAFCRGEHGYLGDCEETGLRLGFDVSREGWMNDYLGWVHDAEDGPQGEVWDGNRKVHWNGEELEFPALKKEDDAVVDPRKI